MPMIVDDTRLPAAVEAGAQWLLTTETYVSSSPGGTEQRQSKREPRWEGTLSVGPEYVADVRDLFYSQVGPRWAFKAWCSAFDRVEDGELEQDPVTGNWPMIALLGPGLRKRVKRILLPDTTVYPLVVKVDNIPTLSYTLVNDANGFANIIDFDTVASTNGPVPITGSLVTLTARLLLPFRFAEDNLSITSIARQNDTSILQTVQQFRVVEVLS